MPRGPIRLDELAGASRFFYAACAAWALDRPVNLRVRGTSSQIAAIAEAIAASRAFDATLMSESATVESVMECLDRKRSAAHTFRAECGVPWPL